VPSSESHFTGSTLGAVSTVDDMSPACPLSMSVTAWDWLVSPSLSAATRKQTVKCHLTVTLEI